MIEPSINDLLKKVGNDRSMLCIITAMRARQLLGGAECVARRDTGKRVTDAINEINEGKISYTRKRTGI